MFPSNEWSAKKEILPKSQCLNNLEKQWLIDFDINWAILLISTLKLSLILTATCQNTNGRWIRFKDTKMIKKSVGCYIPSTVKTVRTLEDGMGNVKGSL